MNKDPLITPYNRLEIIDGILHATYLGGVIDIDVAKEIVRQRLEYIEGVAYPTLVMDSGVISMTKEARDYFSDKDGGSQGVVAGVLLLKSVYSEFLGNFFLRVAKPAIPTRVFTDKEKALEWLQQFKPKS